MSEVLILSILANVLLTIMVIKLMGKKKQLEGLATAQFSFMSSDSTELAHLTIRNIDLEVENDCLKKEKSHFENAVKYLKSEAKKDMKIEHWLLDRLFEFNKSEINKDHGIQKSP